MAVENAATRPYFVSRVIVTFHGVPRCDLNGGT